MATPDKSLFKEKTQREKDQEMISGIAAKAAMDAGISKNARARLDTSSSAIKDAIRRRNLAQKQLDERNAKKDAKKKTEQKNKRNFMSDGSPKNGSAKDDKPVEKKTPKKALFGEGDAKTRNGKANVSRKQLSDFGGTLTQYMNQWNKSGKRPTKVSKDASGSGSGTKTDSPAKKTFRQRRAANLKAKIADENVGEGRKRRLKRRLGRVERRMAQGKAGGGMMKSKMSSKGGKMGGKMVRGYKDGDEVKKTENKKVRYVLKKRKEEDKVSNYTPNPGNKKARYVLKERKDKDKPSGKMAKKGYATGGVAKKPVPPENKGLKKLPKDVRNKMGYMKGGGMAKKGYSKGGAVKKKSKPRGVGVALRGYGKAMR